MTFFDPDDYREDDDDNDHYNGDFDDSTMIATKTVITTTSVLDDLQDRRMQRHLCSHLVWWIATKCTARMMTTTKTTMTGQPTIATTE